MPVATVRRYTCPITHDVAYVEGTDLPPRWFEIQGQCFSPNAQVPLAQYVVDHPTIGFKALIASLVAQPEPVAQAVMARRPLARQLVVHDPDDDEVASPA